MLKKMFRKIRGWWRAKIEFADKIKEYERELESGTMMRGGSFLNMMKNKDTEESSSAKVTGKK